MASELRFSYAITISDPDALVIRNPQMQLGSRFDARYPTRVLTHAVFWSLRAYVLVVGIARASARHGRGNGRPATGRSTDPGFGLGHSALPIAKLRGAPAGTMAMEAAQRTARQGACGEVVDTLRDQAHRNARCCARIVDGSARMQLMPKAVG